MKESNWAVFCRFGLAAVLVVTALANFNNNLSDFLVLIALAALLIRPTETS